MPRCGQARSAYLPLISQPPGILGSSGKSFVRASAGQVAPNNLAACFRQCRKSCGATKHPFHMPKWPARASASYSLKRPRAEGSKFNAHPFSTSHRLTSTPSTEHWPVRLLGCFGSAPSYSQRIARPATNVANACAAARPQRYTSPSASRHAWSISGASTPSSVYSLPSIVSVSASSA